MAGWPAAVAKCNGVRPSAERERLACGSALSISVARGTSPAAAAWKISGGSAESAWANAVPAETKAAVCETKARRVLGMGGLLVESCVPDKASETIFVLTAKWLAMSRLEGDVKVANKPEIAAQSVY
jgi:hypothetical protein